MKRLERCMPREIAEIQKKRIPLVIPGGTVEYHGPHCAYGCDGLIVEKLLERVGEQTEIAVAPTVWYSPSSYAVGDKTSGTVHVEENIFENYCYEMFRSFLYSGFRNIYVVIHHQFEQETLMPMTLCYLKAAKRATMRYLEETQGEGWWGSENYSHYYEEMEKDGNPFRWIQVIPTMTKAVQDATGYDHAGEFETSLLWALAPDTVDISRIDDRKHWFTESARAANEALGEQMAKLTVASLVERLK